MGQDCVVAGGGAIGRATTTTLAETRRTTHFLTKCKEKSNKRMTRTGREERRSGEVEEM
jgi:hypothetical protein